MDGFTIEIQSFDYIQKNWDMHVCLSRFALKRTGQPNLFASIRYDT